MFIERPIFALIVGIDKYEDGGPSMLRGCVNDSKLMFDYLKDTLHVPKINIRILINEEATRENIMETFESHFARNSAINPGDAMFFYFAGHGSRQKAPNDWHCEGMRVETICPYNLATTSGIPDYTFSHLLRQLSFYKGNNITLIFDSCHSGGMTRVEMEMDENAPLIRGYEPTDDLPPLPTDLDRSIWSWRPESSERSEHSGSAQPDPTESFYKAMETHVLLAACQPSERARETNIDGVWSGVFTSALLASLRVWDPSLTYLRLMEQLPPLEGQQPHCEGTNKVRRLFSPSDDEKDDSSWFVVTAAAGAVENAYYVAAGFLLGIVRGAEFITHPPKGFTPITLTVTHVEECRCRVVPKDTASSGTDSHPPSTSILPHHSRATISKWRTKWLQVELEPRDAFPAIIENNDTLFSIVESGGDLKASLADSEVELVRNDPLISSQPECRIISTNIDKVTRHYLDDISRFHFFLYQHNKSNYAFKRYRTSENITLNLNPVTVSFRHLISAPTSTGPRFMMPIGNNLFHLPSSESATRTVLAGVAVLEGLAADDYYGLTLNNHTSMDLFPYVFFFDPRTYTITPVYLPHSPTSYPLTRCGTDGSTLGIGYGAQGTDKMCFSLPPGFDHDSGFFKVFVSATYINMKAILQTPERLTKKWNYLDVVEKCWASWIYLITKYFSTQRKDLMENGLGFLKAPLQPFSSLPPDIDFASNNITVISLGNLKDYLSEPQPPS